MGFNFYKNSQLKPTCLIGYLNLQLIGFYRGDPTNSFSEKNRRSTKFQKDMVHRQVPLPMPCYDFSLVINPILGPAYARTSDRANSPAVTGGEYKAQGHIHRGVADPRLLAIPAS